MNLPKGATVISHDVYDLHMMVIWICVVIGIGVFGAIFISVLMHRKSKGAVAAQFHESTTVEIIWTIVPFVILVGMAIPASKVLIAESDTANSDLTVKVTGYQWKWHYDYPSEGISFFSTLSTPTDEIYNDAPKDKHYLREVDHPLVLPIHKKIRFLITANDVIHAWWVPAFAIQADAIPGYEHVVWTEIEKPGIYRGQCAMICGRGHAFMPIVVVAKTDADFKKWVAEQKAGTATAAVAETAAVAKTWTKDELVAKGKQVYDANCAACHQPTGSGVPGTFPPIAAGKPFSASAAMMQHLTERGFLKDGKIVMGPVKHHIETVLKGIPGTAMPAWGPQLSDVDIASVITYERNAFGNHTGDVVQPSEVKAAR
ncbi:MAG TPA: cytochrome c oxidase subunit II [Gammaproteobacteria bacterium]|nr:cytochrome c oxidase subunit II [Gammaproteobacteria bacterium]